MSSLPLPPEWTSKSKPVKRSLLHWIIISIGGLVTTLCLCVGGLTALGRNAPRTPTAIAYQSVSSAQQLSDEPSFVPTSTAILVTNTAVPPTAESTQTPTPIPSQTSTPSLTPTFAPPTGNVIGKADLLEAAIRGNVSATSFGLLCAGDQLEYLSQQYVDGSLWYEVRILVVSAETCSSDRVSVGNIGWLRAGLVTAPSFTIDSYAREIGKILPTDVVSTRTPTPVPTTQPRVAPAAPAAPSGVRVGAICRDGSRSSATGRGACSHHGGVARWLYR